jgi:hypothetical protein
MDDYFVKKFEEAKTISDVFEVVKELVWKSLGKSRAGLDLGLIEIAAQPQGLIGAFFVMGSNMIIMNETPLKKIKDTNPELRMPYTFSILLHEYLHSLGVFSEEDVKTLTYDLSLKAFGEKSIVTEISKDMTKFFPNLIYPRGELPQTSAALKLVKGFDKSDTGYIG